MQELAFNTDVIGTGIPCLYIRDALKASSALSILQNKDVLFGVDIETTPKKEYSHIEKAGLFPMLSEIRLLQIYDSENCYVFDLLFIPFDLFIDFLESKRFIAHNAVFELQNFLYNGVGAMNIGCTMLLSKLIMHATYPTDSGISSSLASLVKICFGIELNKAGQKSDFSPNELTFEQIEYACLDAIYVIKLAEKMVPGLQKLRMFDIYNLVKEAQSPISSIQLNGICLNVPYYRTLIDKWREELYAAKKNVLKITGLSEITGAKLGEWLQVNLPTETLQIWPRTSEDSDRLSTSADTFADFSYLPIVKPFSEYQKKEKMVSTYGINLLNRINVSTGRIHANYMLLGARTGRLSSSYPNLQNLPRDPEIRKSFIPAPGHKFLFADYSQIELRVAAELSQDATMLEAYKQGIDLHALTASKVAGKPLKSVTKNERQMAKALNFGLLFGLGAKKFSHYAKKSYGVEVSSKEAYEAVNVFRDTYAGYRVWQMEQAENAQETFISKTPLGKVRKLSEENVFGASMNTPVQGGAAEVVERALVRIDKQIDNVKIKLVQCVHDEIGLEVIDQPDYIQIGREILKESMIDGFRDIFPAGITTGLVEIGMGDNWGEAK